jgi:hypothetical protein
MLLPLRLRISRFTRFVRDAGSVFMGVLTKDMNTSCFKHPTLFGNDFSVVSLRSKTFREIILPITLFGIFVKSLLKNNTNERICGALKELGSELNLFMFKNI